VTVYPPKDDHPFQYEPGPTYGNFVHATNDASHYTTPPTDDVMAYIYMCEYVSTQQSVAPMNSFQSYN